MEYLSKNVPYPTIIKQNIYVCKVHVVNIFYTLSKIVILCDRKQLLRSPLLSRRKQQRSPEESSDEEFLLDDTEVLCSSSNYKDLETFQKTRLRNKVME